jgi:arylsulfatase A-like enzyme
MKHINKWIFTLLVICTITETLTAQSRPNIVVIVADDLGYGSANAYGASKAMIRTPNMDQLAQDGMLFTDANTPASVCTPTRYALLTGRYAWRGRLKYGVMSPPEAGLLIEDELLTLPEYLQQKGYNTAHIGKWHLGYTNQENVEDLSAQPLVPGPNSLGFDYHFGVPNQIDWLPKVYVENDQIWGLRSKGKHPYGRSSYKNQPYHGYDAPQRVTTNVQDDLNEKAREWIFKTSRDEPETPFFLYFAAVTVHNPVAPGEKLRGTSGCGPYGDYIHDFDNSVGEIMDALAYSGKLENTLVIFTSDNGGDRGQIEEVQARDAGFKNNGDFRGDKHSIFEGGFRVPLIARWPGHIEEGTVSDRMINLVDIYATVQEMLSGEILPAEEAGADSFSFYDELIDKRKKNAVRTTMVVNNVNGVVAIRKGKWKYIEGIAAKKMSKGAQIHLADELSPQLYNLETDISETENCIDKYPKIYEDLKQTLAEIRESGSERLTAK